MSRTMMILQAIFTAIMPAHRHFAAPRQHQRPMRSALARDAEELERGAREQYHRSTCYLLATAERVLLGHRPEQLNGHGEHKPGIG
jgi:hypothetical protein